MAPQSSAHEFRQAAKGYLYELLMIQQAENKEAATKAAVKKQMAQMDQDDVKIVERLALDRD